MAWIEPLALQTWLINVFAGDATFFSAIAIFIIVMMTAYFRMNAAALGFIVIVFLLMFSGFVPPSLLIFAVVFLGLIVGYLVSKIVKN